MFIEMSWALLVNWLTSFQPLIKFPSNVLLYCGKPISVTQTPTCAQPERVGSLGWQHG